MPAPKKKKLSLSGRPPAEVGIIIAVVAAGVIILAVFLEWLVSGKGLLAQRRGEGGEEDGGGE